MNTKVILASLAAGVASFLLGWVVFGMLLMGYYESNMNPIEGMWREEADMNMVAMLLANLGWGTIVGWSLWRMGVNTAMGGAVPGAILGGLITFSMDMYFLAMSNMYANTTIIVVDVLVNVCMSAVLGAVAGLVLGMGKKAA
ncbi:MAG: hypothetical protein IPG10_14870 [Flavobacteriales bacterium]|jgi:hypothetical protein|nr:hypothetical protein [Flavobacteriales bacterium]MBK6755918.1 hypothetical protein [Flavobacteriales bacterium]MBK7084853.1 hypothetical protein [Flavobacteriales bacterium]MBK7751591.1 hypothetical protein [Flavobacteriales bacterium]MBK9073929.1 hypothetical protein [Flavobacteriales bacterium]